MSKYIGSIEFTTDWSTVCDWWSIKEPAPDELLYASYDTPSYEGYGEVIYRRGNSYFYVTGSHCSCYGLEDQWSPEEYTAEQLADVIERVNYGAMLHKRDELLAMLAARSDDQ